MEKEILFTTSKWDILQEIAKSPHAPLGIAKILNTTIANVSQQLRLLEAAGLVKKQRVANVGAGQPRALFSLSNDFAFLSLVSRGLAKKKLLKISKLQVAVSRVWLLEILESDVLAKFLYTHESLLLEIGELYFVSIKGRNISLEAKNSTLASEKFSINFDGNEYIFFIKKVEIVSLNAELIYNEN